MKIQKYILDQIQQEKTFFQLVYHIDQRYVNDHCFVFEKDDIHLFYIDGEVGKTCTTWNNEIQIGHATSRDLYRWQEHSPALIRDIAIEYEQRGVFAPYVIKKNNLYYMFYSSHNKEFSQTICMAFSHDLYRWERYHQNPVIVPKGNWADWAKNRPCSCRDPHVFYNQSKDEYVMYWVGDMTQEGVSCISASTSKDLLNWTEIGPILIRKHSNHECFTMKTESPCLIQRHGHFFLFYRHGNGTKYCISKDLLNFHHQDGYYLSSSHASEIFTYQDQWFISHCSRKIEDIEHKTDRTQGLYLAKMDWNDFHPRLIDSTNDN